MNYTGITLLQIDYFIAAAAYLNFTEAAKSLYITQPSLSKQIAALETEIGFQLFFRNKRNIRLTPAGTELYRELKSIPQLIEQAIEKAKDPCLYENPTLSIGCLNTIDTGWFLPEIIQTFQRKHPKINVLLERHGFKSLREKFVQGSLDIIFTLSFEVKDASNLLCHSFSQHNICVVMSASNPMAQRKKLSLLDFKDQNFISISKEESPEGVNCLFKLCHKHNFLPKVTRMLPNIESILLSVESGFGITVVDNNIRIHNRENFRILDLKDEVIDIVLASQKDNCNPAIPVFINHVTRHAFAK